jgi:hypothetical protein
MRVARNLRSANVGMKIKVTSRHGDFDESQNENPRKEGSFVKEGGRDVNSYSRFSDR